MHLTAAVIALFFKIIWPDALPANLRGCCGKAGGVLILTQSQSGCSGPMSESSKSLGGFCATDRALLSREHPNKSQRNSHVWGFYSHPPHACPQAIPPPARPISRSLCPQRRGVTLTNPAVTLPELAELPRALQAAPSQPSFISLPSITDLPHCQSSTIAVIINHLI